MSKREQYGESYHIFLWAMDQLHEFEGGMSLDENDPGNWTGGRKGQGKLRGTKYGISAKAYPHLDIAGLTKEAAEDIYFKDYWLANMCDRMPPQIAICVFDFAVNAGRTAIRKLQLVVGAETDGIVGPVTVGKVKTFPRPDDLTMEYNTQRILFYTKLAHTAPDINGRFVKGWVHRVLKLHERVQSWYSYEETGRV